MTKGNLTIKVMNGETVVSEYYGEAKWHTDSVPMVLRKGKQLDGYDADDLTFLEIHADLCRGAALELGLETEEIWEDEGFQGGRLR